MRRESAYQSELIERIKSMFPGCFVMKTDPSECQGIPDILVLIGNTWVMLEVKRSAREPFRPNQEYYLEHFNGMSFAASINPENEEQVLDELQSTLGACR